MLEIIVVSSGKEALFFPADSGRVANIYLRGMGERCAVAITKDALK